MPITVSHAATALAALAAVLGLVWVVQKMARLGGFVPHAAAGGRRLAVREAIALDARRRLHLVQCDGRQVIILTGGGQDLVVGWLPAPGAES